MTRVVDLTVSPEESTSEATLRQLIERAAREPVAGYEIVLRSVDARRRVRIRLAVRVWGPGELPPREHIPTRPEFPARCRPGPPVVVVGAGPAGLFAALRLRELGVSVVVLERGKPVQARRRDLAALNKQGIVDPESNYCYGEGGAGTYSDGKLYTRASKRGPVRAVLETLVAHGAPPEVLFDARPHVGSNRLPRVVTALRNSLASGDVEVCFGSRVSGWAAPSGRVEAIHLADGKEIPAAAIVLATGHSARDVYRICERAGARLEPKSFALGVRVEHPQPLIDKAQYGRDAGHPALGPASYRLATTIRGRGVFSFCMCPGGWIVPATTGQDAVVVNGMSLSRRDSPFANSGLVVAVEPDDLEEWGFPGPLGGIALQRSIEEAGARAGGGRQVAPAVRVADLIAGRTSPNLPPSSYRPGTRPADLAEVLPAPLLDRLRAALPRFARSIRGFDDASAVALGVESRTSSPVRIVRNPGSLESPTVAGLYPCGEGAGYAGGIVSAALDGRRVAERIADGRH